jgi:hypothetical protein
MLAGVMWSQKRPLSRFARPAEKIDMNARRVDSGLALVGVSSRQRRQPMQPIPLRPDVTASARAAVTSLVRAAISTGLRYVSPVGAERKSWPGDRDVELVLRAASAPATTVNSAALTHIAYSFLSALQPFSAAAALVDRSLKLNFDGAASISVPNLTLPNADFVGQGKPIPVVMGASSSGVLLEPHKLATIIALSGEMMRNSNAEAIVRQVLMDNVGPSLDSVMFSAAAAVPDVRPPGLLNGIAGLTPSAGTNKAEALTDDIAALATATAAVSGNGGIILVAAPAQSVALALRPAGAVPFPVLMSVALPAKRVIAVAARALVTAFDAPQIDASRTSALHIAAPAADLADSGGTLAVPVKSLMQIDAVGLRLRMPCGWALRTPTALAWMDNVTW